MNGGSSLVLTIASVSLELSKQPPAEPDSQSSQLQVKRRIRPERVARKAERKSRDEVVFAVCLEQAIDALSRKKLQERATDALVNTFYIFEKIREQEVYTWKLITNYFS